MGWFEFRRETYWLSTTWFLSFVNWEEKEWDEVKAREKKMGMKIEFHCALGSRERALQECQEARKKGKEETNFSVSPLYFLFLALQEVRRERIRRWKLLSKSLYLLFFFSFFLLRGVGSRWISLDGSRTKIKYIFTDPTTQISRYLRSIQFPTYLQQSPGVSKSWPNLKMSRFLVNLNKRSWFIMFSFLKSRIKVEKWLIWYFFPSFKYAWFSLSNVLA